MADLKEIQRKVIEFRNERGWKKDNTPANLAKSIVIEAAELLECFQWSDTSYNTQDVCDELADVLIYATFLAEELGVSFEDVMETKMVKNAKKYPLEETEEIKINQL